MIYLSLGSNIGDRLLNLREAIIQLKKIGCQNILISSVYQTEPWGYIDQPDFYNIILSLDTDLSPNNLLIKTREIEINLGRKRDFVNCPRTIDIDIITFDDQIVNQTELVIPHPRYKDRKFVLAPLVEIQPDFIDPVSLKSIQTLLNECSDQSNIKIVGKL